MSKAEHSSEKKRYHEVWLLIAGVIREWDPYGLLAGGAPTDEYDSEISSLVAQVARIRSSTDAGHAISQVFSASFEPGGFTPDACAVVGERLYGALKESGFVAHEYE